MNAYNMAQTLLDVTFVLGCALFLVAMVGLAVWVIRR